MYTNDNSTLTVTNFISKFSLGIRTFSNFNIPLSVQSKGKRGPSSITVTPNRKHYKR